VLHEKLKIFNENLKNGKLPSPTLQEVINNDGKLTGKQSENTVNGLRDDLDEIDNEDVGIKRRLAFLDLMIETAHDHPEELSIQDINDQVDTLMFEGHDTTAAASSFFLCLLGVHQDIQNKVMDEMKAIFGDSDRDCTYADTVEMKYLERVLLETLRLYPPVPLIARKVNEDVKLASKNYIIPAKSTVVIGTFLIHRHPDIYQNPDKFDPDNFLPERTAGRHYYGFIPFAAGPRSCVGRKYAMLKLKVLLSTIVRNFHITSNVTEADFKLQGDILLKRFDGFHIKLDSRKI
jgi:cytochrome P450 family 4